MNKLQMAHEYFMKHGRNNSWMESDVIDAWKYADAMQDEADKREPSGFPDVLRGACGEIVAVKVDDKEWQPDWSQAPDEATYWAMDKDSSANFFRNKPEITNGNGWDFGGVMQSNNAHKYTGNWRDSLRKRPQ